MYSNRSLTPQQVTGNALAPGFNDLIGACSQKKGNEEGAHFLTFLTGYVNRHFDDEERAMTRHVYDGLEDHIKEHEQYRKQLEKLKEDLTMRGTTDEVVSEAVWVAANWLPISSRRTRQWRRHSGEDDRGTKLSERDAAIKAGEFISPAFVFY